MLVDRLTWLATAAPNGQVRAIASWKLARLAVRLKGAATVSEGDQAQNALLAADIKRFVERPAETVRMIPAPDSPPGAPIGDPGMDWLAPAPLCNWSGQHPDWWLSSGWMLM